MRKVLGVVVWMTVTFGILILIEYFSPSARIVLVLPAAIPGALACAMLQSGDRLLTTGFLAIVSLFAGIFGGVVIMFLGYPTWEWTYTEGHWRSSFPANSSLDMVGLYAMLHTLVILVPIMILWCLMAMREMRRNALA